ncbi:glutamate receptor-like [Penaeus chinensis]|uniref:glutamate receptor-like n=1 Tax=Penaeus chinensis TaxID=139456 RepID=UPI001FB5EA40|nr:glutamate receptor-like [Penaeus chinensis]
MSILSAKYSQLAGPLFQKVGKNRLCDGKICAEMCIRCQAQEPLPDERVDHRQPLPQGGFPSLSYINPARGPAIDILRVVAEKLNLCYELVPSVDGLWGAKLPNGSWFGMLGMLERKEVDMSVGPFAPSTERATVADFSVPILISDHTIIYPRPQVLPDLFGFVKPFALVVWMAVLISLLTVTASSRLPTLYRRGRRGESEGENLNSILWAFMVLLGQALPPRLVLGRKRIVQGLWMLTGVIIGSVYKSNLKAMLIVPKLL